jgi:hypothetical protein
LLAGRIERSSIFTDGGIGRRVALKRVLALTA